MIRRNKVDSLQRKIKCRQLWTSCAIDQNMIVQVVDVLVGIAVAAAAVIAGDITIVIHSALRTWSPSGRAV